MTSSSAPSGPSTAESALLIPSAHLRRDIVVAISTIVVLLAAGFVLRFVPIDVAFSNAVHHLHVSVLTQVAEGFYRSLKPLPAAGIMVVATVAVGLLSRRWQVALAFFGGVAVTWGLAEAAKLVVDRPRPGMSEAMTHAVGATADPSFPSGHVAFTASFAAVLICALWATRWRALGIVVGVVLVVGMSVSVVIIGVHYAGDALASIVWVAGVYPAVRAVGALLIPRVGALLFRRPVGAISPDVGADDAHGGGVGKGGV
ncbi:undecaprenyl-diphosphatase [Microbacterium sp. AG157]|uniref:phosphatase PAP2 family protein n=1 Tax=Microbacterium TaxID=33882 RepID=UPI000CCFA8BA|nr:MULTISPECIES: phosphatase PAP2 family protein [Microbacterium]PNW10564.1 phosphoesterase [Microbacterium testaceum]REC98447.1 undecaprenyl-diphosphatase [Microbacterium sp. AG157]